MLVSPSGIYSLITTCCGWDRKCSPQVYGFEYLRSSSWCSLWRWHNFELVGCKDESLKVAIGGYEPVPPPDLSLISLLLGCAKIILDSNSYNQELLQL